MTTDAHVLAPAALMLAASWAAPQSTRPSPKPPVAILGPLFFDPRGADFTAWVGQFKDETYRRWTVPEEARKGLQGQVDIEFQLTRDGALQRHRTTRSSGSKPLDTAASKALQATRFPPLPADFPDSTVTMQLTFWYNSSPKWAKD